MNNERVADEIHKGSVVEPHKDEGDIIKDDK